MQLKSMVARFALILQPCARCCLLLLLRLLFRRFTHSCSATSVLLSSPDDVILVFFGVDVVGVPSVLLLVLSAKNVEQAEF